MSDAEKTLQWVLSVGMVMGLVTIVVNLAAIVVIVQNKFLWTPSYLYMASLATTDLLTGCTLFLLCLNVVPGFTTSVFSRPGICLPLMLLIATCTLASLLTFAVVSVDRYISIALPFFYNNEVTNKRVIVLILAVWMLALILSIVVIYLKIRSPIPLCVWSYPIESELYIICGTIYFCVLVSGIMYALISRLALRHVRKIAEQTASLTAWVQAGRAAPRETFRQKLRAVKMFVVVLGVFCVFWGPFVGAVTMHHLVKPQSISVLDFTYLLGLLNSLANIFIYMRFNGYFRTTFKRLFIRR